MQLVVLAAGAGSRFKKNGYSLPKPLVEFCNHPLFWWATQSALSSCNFDSIHFVVLKEHINGFNIDKEILKNFPSATIHQLDKITLGAAMTVAEVAKSLNPLMPFCAVDCDLAFSFDCSLPLDIFKNKMGGLCLFKSVNRAYSYVQFDNLMRPIATFEKKVVSNDAIAGIYYFSSPTFFLENYYEYCNQCEYQELFLSGIFNTLLNKNFNIGTILLRNHISLGTPEELVAAKMNIKDLLWFKQKND
jgi:NDP-sugar pyrophosphorylase family protein